MSEPSLSNQSLAQLQNLKGKTAIVTGAGRGMGSCIALRLAEAGAAVVAMDFAADGAETVAAQIREAGGRAVAMRADAASTADAERVMQCALDEFGSLDILVNNAGLFPPSPLLDIDEALWDRVHNVNLRGLFFYSQIAAKRMIAQGRGGCIVNIASVSGTWPSAYLAHYDASKGGVIMLTKSLAKELGPHGIRVNAVAPGGVATPGGKETSSKMFEVLGIPEGTEMPVKAVIGRNAEADDIARAVFFLAGDLAAAITGVTLPVEAGYLLA